MNIDELTLGQIKQLQAMLGQTQATGPCCRSRYVIVRSRSAGVFFAKIVAERPTEVDVIESRHIWSWQGALTVSDIAVNGVKSAKISAPVTQTIAEKLEVIDCSDRAAAQLSAMVSS